MIRWLCSIFVMVLVLTGSSCASTKIANISDDQHLNLAEDEANLWKVVEELQFKLNKSGALYSDPALDQYLDDVVSRVAGPGFEEKYGVDLKVYVIKDPYFNAFAFPNGSIYVHTGLLASMENEAQLAHVLGHEATHFMNRHVLRQWRSTVNKTALMKSFEILTSGVAAYGGIAVAGIVGDLTGLGIIGTMAGYSRELEEEADAQGFAMIRDAGYDAAQSVRTFEILEDALKDEKNKVPFFYSSHPQAKARVTRMKKLVEKMTSAGELTSPGEIAAERYEEMIQPLILDNVELDIKRNNLRLARRQVERYIARRDTDPRGYFLLGEINRGEWSKPADKKSNRKKDAFKDQEKDFFAEAESAYLKSMNLDATYAESCRGLGLLYYKKKDFDRAKEQFEKYLSLRPLADDAEYIRGYLSE